MTTPRDQPLLPVIEEALRLFGIDFQATSPIGRTGRLVGAAAIYDVFAYGDDATSFVACTLTFAVRIPEARRAAVGEALHRINLETPIGAFELDYDTGILRFRTGVDMENAELVPHTSVIMLSAGRQICDTYHAAIMRVAFGDVIPAIAVAEARAALASPETGAAPDESDDTIADVEPISEAELAVILRSLDMNGATDREPPNDTRMEQERVMASDQPVDVPTRAPHANSYVVPGTRLVAGEYPGAKRASDARAKLAACLDAGITAFIDLTHPHELEPYELILTALAAERGISVEYHRMPIQDMGVAELSHMRAVLDTIDRALDARHSVYVHCWGGVGRTGTVVGCWLVRHGMAGDAALAEVGRLFATMSPAKLARHNGSPQTSAQRRFVRQWASFDPA